ncbi:hypothetical protein MKX01_032528, partial [Papaver californicum]
LFAWNILLNMYVKSDVMFERNTITILKLFVSIEFAELCLRVHACIFKLGHDSNPFVGIALIDAYSISCYSENGYFEEALELFCCMRRMGLKPNNFTFDSSLKALVGLGSASIAKYIHGCTLKSQFELDPYISTALLD